MHMIQEQAQEGRWDGEMPNEGSGKFRQGKDVQTDLKKLTPAQPHKQKQAIGEHGEQTINRLATKLFFATTATKGGG